MVEREPRGVPGAGAGSDGGQRQSEAVEMRWAAELLWPDETASERLSGWVPREAVPNPVDAIILAARELEVPPGRIILAPVLMREESEVEARINGHEFPFWVECTKRARSFEPFWRVTLS